MSLLALGMRRQSQVGIFDPGAPPINLVVDGNSIFGPNYTSVGTFDMHMMSVGSLASSGATHAGVAVGGGSWADLISKAAATVDPLWEADATNVLVVMETINSLADGTPVATIKAQIEAYLDGRLSLHPWRVIYCRTVPYGGSGAWATFNANMTEIDDWVQTNAASLGVDAVVDFRTMPVFDHDGTTSGPFETYNAQWQENAVPFVHPLDVPKAGMAAIVVAALEAL